MGKGGGSMVTGYKYKGSLAIAVCIGAIDELREISNGDSIIWSSEDVTGIPIPAKFALPSDICLDPDGNFFVADADNAIIRKITPAGVVSTFAGTWVPYGSEGADDGTGAAARFFLPSGIDSDYEGYLYVGDTYNHTVRKISPAGVVTTLAGDPTILDPYWLPYRAPLGDYVNGTGAAARFNHPRGVAVDTAGNVFVADCANHCIRKIRPDGVVTTFAGRLPVSGIPIAGWGDGTGTAASFRYPTDLAFDSAGNLFVADSGNHIIRKITLGGVVTTLAGQHLVPGYTDGTGTAAQFNTPYGIAVDGSGNIIVSDSYNDSIRKVTQAGVVTTIAGNPLFINGENVSGPNGLLDNPRGLIVASDGNYYVTDCDHSAIRKVTPAGAVTTFAGIVGNSGHNDPDAEISTIGATPAGADSTGKTILETTLGTIHFYWGTAEQDLDPALESLLVDNGDGPLDIPFPTLKNVCYAVAFDLDFGSAVVPPILQFTYTRYTNGLSLSAPKIDTDIAVPEVIYELLTNTLYGASIPAANIDNRSFARTGETTITEGIAASPFFDDSLTVREMVGRLQQYIDAVTYFDGITIHCDAIRYADSTGLPVVDETELLDEPRLTDKSADCRNKTVLTFADRTNKWESTSEAFDHIAHATVSGEVLRDEISLPYITSRTVAKKLVAVFGARAGQPRAVLTLRLGPSWSTLHPGSRLKVTYTKYGITEHVVRVTEVRRGGVTDPVIEIDCITDLTRATDTDYTPPADDFTIPHTVDPNGESNPALVSTTPRLMPLPTGLLAGFADGFLVAMDRPSIGTIGADVWWTWDPLQRSYSQLLAMRRFPVAARLVWWHRSTRTTSTTWLVRIELLHAWDVATMDGLLDGAPGIYFVTGRRLVRTVTKDEHQTLGIWGLVADGGRNQASGTISYDLEVWANQLITDDFALELSTADSVSPTSYIYLGQPDQFAIHLSDILKFDQAGGNSLADTANKRWVATPTRTFQQVQGVSDVTAAWFDKDDTTMCADGSLSPTWGVRAQPTYELLHTSSMAVWTGSPEPQFGLQEINRNLLAGYLQSTPDTELLSDIDRVLGAVYFRNDQIYNDTP